MNTNKRFNQYRKLIKLMTGNIKGVKTLNVVYKAERKLMPWKE